MFALATTLRQRKCKYKHQNTPATPLCLCAYTNKKNQAAPATAPRLCTYKYKLQAALAITLRLRNHPA